MSRWSRARRVALAVASLAILCRPPMLGALQWTAGPRDAENPAIAYSTTAPADAVARLQHLIDTAQTSLHFDEERGYMPVPAAAMGDPSTSVCTDFTMRPGTPPVVCGRQTIVGVLTSEDGGRTWTRRTGTAFDTSSVPAIAVHPQNQDTAWVGTLGKWIFKTTNGGTTWTGASTGLGDLDVESLAVDPARPDVLYAGTFSKGVYKSRDGGVVYAGTFGEGVFRLGTP